MSALDDPMVTTFGRLAERFGRLERALSQDIQQRFGMPQVWFEVLQRLARSLRGRLTMSELGGQVSLTTGGVTRLIDRMTQAGYVRREPCPADRRVSYAVVTEAGLAAVEEAARVHAANVRKAFASLTPAELRTLDALLDRLRPAPAP